MKVINFYPHLITQVHSLRVRLIVLCMLVVLVAVGMVALIASQTTASNLQVYQQTKTEQQAATQQITTTLLTAYQQHQSQQALQALTEQLAHSSHQRIILLDQQHRVITDSERLLNPCA